MNVFGATGFSLLLTFLQLFSVGVFGQPTLGPRPQCTLPPYSRPLHEVSFTAENKTLLLTEGRCYLTCLRDVRDGGSSTNVGIRTIQHTLYEAWPFPIVDDDSTCTAQQSVHECTRGCRTWLMNETITNNLPRTWMERSYAKYYCNEDCRADCKAECNGQTRCTNLDSIDRWIARSGCTVNCLRLIECGDGCSAGDYINNASILIPPTRPPTQPLAPPRLTPLDKRHPSSFRAGAYSINLTEAMPPTSRRTNLPLVGFLFKIYDNASGNITFIWQHDPRENLDLSSHACRSVEVSFAVVSSAGPSHFSDVVALEVYGERSYVPLPPENVQVVASTEDRRIGFFQHVAVNITWQRPHNSTYLVNYTVLMESSNDITTCGTSPLSVTLDDDPESEHYSVMLAASTRRQLPVMGCRYMITVATVGNYGNSSRSLEYTAFAQSVTDYITLSCEKMGRISMHRNIFYFVFNLTLSLAPHVAYGDYIKSFNVTSRVIERIQDIRSDRESPVINTERELPPIIGIVNTPQYTRIVDDNDRPYRPRVNAREFFRFELEINWNTRALFFSPPRYIYKCTLDGLSLRPSEVVNFTLLSYEVQSREVRIVASWEPPAEVNGNLQNYTMCVTPTPLQGHEESRSNCKEGVQSNLTAIDTNFIISSSNDNQYIYLQMRAYNEYIAGNWSEPVEISIIPPPPTSNWTEPVEVSIKPTASGLGIGPILGITFGAIIAVIIALLCVVCTCVCFKMLRRRKKMMRMSQTTAHYDPMFNTVGFGPRMPTLVNHNADQSLVSQDDWELSPSDILVDDSLGEGAFGEVYKGFLKGPIICSKVKPAYRKAVHVNVAIKLLKDSAKGSERKDFLSEIEMMKKVSEGHSPHVVGMLGCVTVQEPLCLVIEFVQYGDLLSYLRTNRKTYVSGTAREEEDPYLQLGQIAPIDLISFAYQTAAGMAYLSSIGIVHRDLACRNILVDEGKVLKITDFGMSRETDEVYIQKSKGRVPYKWMAIESIMAREFTLASDVWSYGVVLWEIGTLGGAPYPGVANEELLPLLKRGHRMEKPDNCSSEMYDIMLSCWHEEATKRPSFSELQAKFDSMLSTQGNNPYIDFSINPEKLCYTVEGDEPGNHPNGLLHLPGTANRRSQLSNGFGRPLSLYMNHSSTRNLAQEGANNSTRDLRKSCSPSEEKPHASNPLNLMLEKEDGRRPSSMMLLRNRDSRSGKEDDDRYVKDPSVLANTTLALPTEGQVMSGLERGGSVRVTSGNHETNNVRWIRGSHEALNLTSAAPTNVPIPPPEIEITES